MSGFCEGSACRSGGPARSCPGTNSRSCHFALAEFRFWRYDEIPEVSDRSRPDPQRDSALSVRTRLHIVDDERGLLLVVDVEARPFAAHLDPDFRPPIRLEIDVRLVFGRGLLAQSGPGPIGIRDVLSRVIAALLIFGTPIRGP